MRMHCWSHLVGEAGGKGVGLAQARDGARGVGVAAPAEGGGDGHARPEAHKGAGRGGGARLRVRLGQRGQECAPVAPRGPPSLRRRPSVPMRVACRDYQLSPPSPSCLILAHKVKRQRGVLDCTRQAGRGRAGARDGRACLPAPPTRRPPASKANKHAPHAHPSSAQSPTHATRRPRTRGPHCPPRRAASSAATARRPSSVAWRASSPGSTSRAALSTSEAVRVRRRATRASVPASLCACVGGWGWGRCGRGECVRACVCVLRAAPSSPRHARQHIHHHTLHHLHRSHGCAQLGVHLCERQEGGRGRVRGRL